MNEPTMNKAINMGSAALFEPATSGRLIFARGAAGVTLHADPTLSHLYRAHFERHVPLVDVHNNTVTMHYRHDPWLGWLVYAAHEPLADITLNGAIPWEIEVRGGVSNLMADLRRLSLRALDVLGGASHIMLRLPAPTDAVFLHIAGGVSDLIIHRPADAALRLQIHGGVNNLSFDGRHVGAQGAAGRWESPGYGDAADRYDISIGGGASNVIVGKA